jgi:D-beta-D-heptose 7-phosphate kinase/D-beta-D-heptose 1-phosphate adenosyltransferase
VDYVVFFGDDTPERLIRALVPDVLVKGADWKPGAIVGGDIVRANGGIVRTIPLTRGRSTTALIDRILRVHRRAGA